jgi:hypothetical protein
MKKIILKRSYILITMLTLLGGQLHSQTASAYKVITAKTIDGDLSDWDLTSNMYEAKKMKIEDGSPWIPKDNKMFWKSAWDDTNFYLIIAVEDKEVVAFSEKTPELLRYSIGFDKNNTNGWGKATSNYGNVIKLPRLGLQPSQGGNFKSKLFFKRTENVLEKGTPGYIIELSVPWAEFGSPSLSDNSKLLFDVQLQDFDRYKGNEKADFINILGWSTTDNTWKTMENSGVLKLSHINK